MMPPALTGDQAGAETDARVPVELRDRLQLHQRSTGSYGNFSIGIGQAARFFWSWPIVIIGQFIVSLVSPSLRATSRGRFDLPVFEATLEPTLGWFTGWFYFWPQVVTVTAVAVIVAFWSTASMPGPS